MKALTLRPEFALQVAWGAKDIEWRTWKTDYRGDILITSSAKLKKGTIPGHALCIVELVDILPVEGEDNLFAWVLDNVRLIKPVPIKGKLSLWESGLEISDLEIIGTNEELDSLPESEDDALFARIWEPLII